MKVSELRQKIKAHNQAELEQIIVELYKVIPKARRDEKEIDALINDPEHFKKQKNSTKQDHAKIDFSTLVKEVNFFIENAYAQNYVVPNRIIPKKERSKWRFIAKRLVDQVLSFSSHPTHKQTCIEMLEELYKLFCYGSGHYVFASQEPFETIKISQGDFFEQIVLLKKSIEEPDRWLTDSLNLILTQSTATYTLPNCLLVILLGALNTAPLKERMIEITQQLLREKRLKLGKVNWKSIDIEDEEYLNTLVTMIFITKSELGESKEAIAFFKKHYIERTEEIKLFILLDMLEADQRLEDWLDVYQDALKKKIEPRDMSQRLYHYIKVHQEFPESRHVLYD
ncbi:hypothetical protein [Amphibacillus indicireducens]|uniref:Uncharacterized protein n=1 Tax=Amphibacillus indicireducens TaxID=1076330 RepID=A0ABP7VVX4_9BACI